MKMAISNDNVIIENGNESVIIIMCGVKIYVI